VKRGRICRVNAAAVWRGEKGWLLDACTQNLVVIIEIPKEPLFFKVYLLVSDIPERTNSINLKINLHCSLAPFNELYIFNLKRLQ
jgi:hypothetical protein